MFKNFNVNIHIHPFIFIEYLWKYTQENSSGHFGKEPHERR